MESTESGAGIPGVRIRQITTPTDALIPACAVLMAGTPLWQRYGVDPARAEVRFREMVTTGVFVCGAEANAQELDRPDPQCQGFVAAVPRGMFNRSGYIPLLGTAESTHGTGLGAALLSAAEGYLAKTAPDVFLLCSDFNTRARRFYERAGYRQAGALPGYLLPDVAEILYWKRMPG